MYHTDETHFYQPDDSRVTRRLLKEKSKLTFVDVYCMFVEGKSRTVFFPSALIYGICRDGSKIITYALVST